MDQFNQVLIIGLVVNVPIRLVSPEGRVSYYINLKTMKNKYNSGTWIKLYCAMDGEEEIDVLENDIVLVSARLIKRKTKAIDNEGRVIYQFALNCYQNNLWNLSRLVSKKEEIWPNDSQPSPQVELGESNDFLSELERGLN